MSQSTRRPLLMLYALTLCLGIGHVSSAAGFAEPVFSLATTPGRLPKTVLPRHYRVDLNPDLGTNAIAGHEVVTIDVMEPTEIIILNALDMTLARASLLDIPGQSAVISLDPAHETAHLAFPTPIKPGTYRLAIDFTGQLNAFGRGLFRVSYSGDGTTPDTMIASQNEPADARRIFPCWDEPAFKASFEPSITVPNDFSAYSNMPVADETPAGSGLKRVSFAATPPMSSYLFIMAAGHLDRISTVADGTEIGIVTTRGKSAYGHYALETSAELIGYYNSYFQTHYPLPKLDMIAVPGGFTGAMENWGGIVYFESRLLYNPATTSENNKRRIFNIIAHEMAHQWFGDLVTMGWWDNLWLNEGFASWMQAKAAEDLHPTWQSWLETADAKQDVMHKDAQASTHPIQQAVPDESAAMSAFDRITYAKGQAFIRNLETYLGPTAFRDGLRRYMKRHAYGNTTTADLWLALQETSGKAVAAIASGYTEQPGFPLIEARFRCDKGQQVLSLSQDRFTINDAAAKPLSWQVPVTLGPPGGTQSTNILVNQTPTETVTGDCKQPVKLNLGDVGYYHVHYDPATQAALTRSIAGMPLADRVNLLGDSWALVESGRVEADTYLALLDPLQGDDSLAVLQQITTTLSTLDRLWQGRSDRESLRAYARHSLQPHMTRLGWDATPGEAPERAIARALLIHLLGQLDDPASLERAKSRFAGFLQDPSSLSADLVDPVMYLAGRGADAATYAILLKLARSADNTEARERYWNALSAASNTALAQKTLDIALGDELPPLLRGRLLTWVAKDGGHVDLVWSFLKSNFKTLADAQAPRFKDTFPCEIALLFSDRPHGDDLARFMAGIETNGSKIELAKTLGSIEADAAFVAKQGAALIAWAKEHG